MTSASLRLAAWAGLQDSMPRAALLSIHARVSDTPTDVLDDPTLVQIWGPRYSAYAIAAADLPIFTLSRMPDDAAGQQRAESTADLLEKVLDGRRMKDRDVYRLLADHPYSLRYATATGRVLIRWEGALAPWLWTVERPQMSIADARLELARRYLHVFGPATEASFAIWAGIKPRTAAATFVALRPELTEVSTPIGDAYLLRADVPEATAEHAPADGVKLLPSGDTYYLLWGRDRELLIPDAQNRAELWTSRVWPGALMVGGDIVGTWRRAHEKFDIATWRALTPDERDAVEEEAGSLPLPLGGKQVRVSWTSSGG